MALEKDIEGAACKRIYDELGIPSFKLTMITDSAWPDRLFVLPNGKVLWVEFKRPGEDPRPNQEYKHELLKAFGHEVKIYDTVDDAVQGVSAAMESG